MPRWWRFDDAGAGDGAMMAAADAGAPTLASRSPWAMPRLRRCRATRRVAGRRHRRKRRHRQHRRGRERAGSVRRQAPGATSNLLAYSPGEKVSVLIRLILRGTIWARRSMKILQPIDYSGLVGRRKMVVAVRSITISSSSRATPPTILMVRHCARRRCTFLGRGGRR
jgi:hypothetical protein